MASSPNLYAELDEALDMASDSLVPDCIRHLAIDWATQRLEYLGFLLDKHLQLDPNCELRTRFLEHNMPEEWKDRFYRLKWLYWTFLRQGISALVFSRANRV
ncbi:hypothetical protein IWX49DRAFT_590210 [Phyllosticta citricarpa]|uniref:Uncharacterized protein n=1 Tax=Phyllosticta paracitricarpa TaxID=2016321 RepID=A0ABR1NJH2_9PEZI